MADHLKEALLALGRPYPQTKVQLFTSLLWQSVRQALHRLYIARVFARQAAKICPDVAKSSRDAADTYHKLLQFGLTNQVCYAIED